MNYKKNAQSGLNGNLSMSYFQGRYGSYLGSLNVNYKKGKINLYSSCSSYENVFVSDTKEDRRIGIGPEAVLMLNSSFIKTVSTGNMLKLGLDWDLAPNQVLGVSLDGTLANYPNSVRGITDVSSFSSPDNVDSSFSTDNNTAYSLKNLNVNVNYEKKIDTNGQKLVINYAYSAFSDHNNTDFISAFYDNEGNNLRDPQFYMAADKTAVDIIAFRQIIHCRSGILARLKRVLKSAL